MRSQVARVKRYEVGSEAESRVVNQLSQFGDATQGPGSDGYPDVFLTTKKKTYGIEVKSTLPYHQDQRQRVQAGVINLNPDAWLMLCERCLYLELEPVLVAEVRFKRKTGYELYHWLSQSAVNWWLDSQAEDSKMAHLNIYELPALARFSWRDGYPIFTGRIDEI